MKSEKSTTKFAVDNNFLYLFLLPFDGAANKQIVWRQTSETQNKYHVNVNALPSWPMSAVIMETSQNKRFPRLLNRTGGEIGKP